MSKKLYYKIGEACKELDIQPYVLRYWESEFQALSPSKSKSGQRVYRAEDLGLIRRIKELLYKEGYTIAGAKKKLESEVVSTPRDVAEPEAEPEVEEVAEDLGTEGPDDAVEQDIQESDQQEAAQPEEAKPPVEVAPQPKPARKKAPQSLKTAPAASSAEKKAITRLQKGIRSALQEARDILEILDRP